MIIVDPEELINFELKLIWLLWSSWKKCQESSSWTDGQDIVHCRWEGSEYVETSQNDKSQEKCIVVENGESGRFIISNFILLPQNSFILFFLAHLLIIGQTFVHFQWDSFLSFHSNLVFQGELRILVSKCHEPSREQGHHQKDRRCSEKIHQMNSPKEPDWNGRYDECIPVEQRIRFCGHISAEILEQQLFFTCKLLRLWHLDHFYRLRPVKSLITDEFRPKLLKTTRLTD